MTLILDNVSKKVGAETWIRDVSLSLERGSLNVLLGPTLAGKTSLMRLMAGLDVPSAGRVLVDGRMSRGCRCSAAASPWSTSNSSIIRP